MIKKHPSLAICLFMMILFGFIGAPDSLAVTDDFQGRTTLGPNWSADPEYQIVNGRLHNSATIAAWDYLATFNGLTNPNQVSMTWAASPFCDDDGAKASGLAICLSSFSPTANGYFIYERNGYIYLYPINSGAITGSPIDSEIRAGGSPAAGPGKTLMVQFFPADFTFKVYINNVLLGTLQDPAKTHNYGTYYSGVFLLGNAANDVEAFTADVVSTGDSTSPSAITNLAATATSANAVQLSWTATGDDGTTGTASGYDIRYSTATITAANFNAATQATGIPAPKAASLAETFSVSGLSAETQYYFAIKARDEAFNWSAISNVPSATTPEGGVTPPPSGEVLSYTDNFDRVALGADWAATTYHQLVDGTLGLNGSAGGGWDYLATFIKSPIAENPVGVAMKFDAVLSDPPAANGTNTCGFGLLLDSPSATANGYLLLYRSGKLTLYNVAGGSAGGPIAAVTALSPDPIPGDVVKVMITIEGGQQKFAVSKNEVAVGTVTIASPTHNPSTWYTGVMQVGGYNNNITYFTIYYQGAGEPGQITEHYGNLQSGPIFSTLPDSVAVRVTDATGNPFEGTVVDFQVVQGTADLSIDEFEYDGLIWYECEKGAVVSPAIIEQDEAASGGAYVVTPYVEGNYRRGRSIMNIYVPEMGNFDLYLRIQCPTKNSNSFFYKFNNEDSVEITYSNAWTYWQWKPVANKTLEKGFHKVHIGTREPGTLFDKIVLNDKNKNPNYTGPAAGSKGGTGPLLPNMSDMNGIAYTYVTFGSDANNDVIINATAYRSDGTTQLDGSPVAFTLDPLPGAAVSMERDPGLADPMVGPPGSQMQTPLRVMVYDQYDNRVPGISINWAITMGSGGSLSDNVSVTDENGEAITYLTLSLLGDNYTVQATNNALTGSPATFNIVPGNPPQTVQLIGPKTQQTTFAGTKVDSLLTVKILDDEGSPFKDYPVEFSVTAGGGSVAAATGKGNNTYEITTEAASSVIVKSDANGLARAQWTLGNTVGLNTVEARASGLIGSPITFTAMGELGPAAILTKNSGDAQTGPVGLKLAKPLEVKLTDAYGNPIPSKAIKFILDQGTGAYIDQAGVMEKTVYTNAEGLAHVELIMGSIESEEHLVRATAVGTEISAVVFTATATAPIAAAIQYVSGNGIYAFDHWVYQDTVVTRPLKDPFVVKVVGPFGKPVANHPVIFSVIEGGGNLSGNAEVTAVSNAEGLVSAKLTLGTLAGDSIHIVEATSFREDIPTQPLNNSPIVFKATARPKPASKLVMDAQTNNQTAQVGQPLPKPVRVLVTDVHGNYIGGHFVTFEIQGEGGQLQDDMGFDQLKQVRTGADDGYASIVWYMPEKPGMVSLNATSFTETGVNLDGSPVTFLATATVGNPDSMARVTADSVLKGIAGKKLAQRPTVKILDGLGNKIAGYPVTFQVKSGEGTVNGAPQVTIPT
ncbi:fibronectin type III domain-containing protein, partial [candidate division KSB1 bacterium]|nr:fibronectin type III domain-containing protein [candidate division KSB1 bacterium]